MTFGSCSQTSSFYQKGTLFHGGVVGREKEQGLAKAFWLLSGKVRGFEPKFSDSFDSEREKHNYKETANLLSDIP